MSEQENNRLDAEGCFILSNGRTIQNVSASKKMLKLLEKAPERSHQISGTGYSWDESGMAQLFAELYEEDTRYCPEAKSWYTYSQGAWRKDIGALLVSAKIKEFYQLISLYCGEIANEERRTLYMKFIVKLGDRRFRDRMLKDASDNDLLVIRANCFDSDPYLINCVNGTYDLKSMEFREHDWRDFLTKQTNFEYTVQDIRCPRWEAFIKEVTMDDNDKAEYLQKALGYSMLGLANEECKAIFSGLCLKRRPGCICCRSTGFCYRGSRKMDCRPPDSNNKHRQAQKKYRLYVLLLPAHYSRLAAFPTLHGRRQGRLWYIRFLFPLQ